MTWTFRAVVALLRGAVVSWLTFSLFAVAGFSLVLCLGYIDCGQWKLGGGGEPVDQTGFVLQAVFYGLHVCGAQRRFQAFFPRLQK